MSDSSSSFFFFLNPPLLKLPATPRSQAVLCSCLKRVGGSGDRDLNFKDGEALKTLSKICFGGKEGSEQVSPTSVLWCEVEWDAVC